MAASPVEIASNALLLLGARSINSFTEDSDFAGMAGALWPTVLDDVLRAHPWNCAVKRVVLAPLAAVPAYEFGYAFQLPSDCLRVLSVGDRLFTDYRIEGRSILMDDSICMLRYVFRNEDTTQYDASLTLLLTFAMASRMAYAVTKSNGIQTTMESQYSEYAKRARAVDGSEDVGENSYDSALIGVRVSG